jgi:hypothetical protein
MKQLAIVVGLLLLAGRVGAQSKNIHENVDPYTGLRTLFLEVGSRTCPGDPSPGLHDPEVHLLFTAMENPDHTVSYLLAPELDRANYSLGLRASGTMDTLIDGVPGGFTTTSGSTTTNYAGNRSYRHETIPFNLGPDDLVRLSKADWFQFRINGPRQDVQRCTDAKHLRDVAEFLDAAAGYGPPQSDVQPGEDAGPPRPFTEKVNSATHRKTLTFANIPTQTCAGDPSPGMPGTEVRLAISANQRSDGGVWYFIATDLYGGGDLNLPRGGNIDIKMDGKTSVFHTINGSLRSYATDAVGRPVPEETTAFHVHQPNLIALSKASAVEIRVTGPDGAAGGLHRCVAADQLSKLGAFIGIAAGYEPSHLAEATPPR